MVNTTGVKPAQGGGGCGGGVLPLASLNHISVVCRSLESSLAFYRNVLGFISIRRPGSFDFSGAWLFNYGVGIHLLQAEDLESMPAKKAEINPKDNHISFTCESIEVVQRRLKEMGIRYVQRRVEEGGIYVDQLFFHDPDGFMIEVCTCDNLPVIPLVPVDAHAVVGQLPPAAACKRPVAKQQQQQHLTVPAAVPAAPAPAACKRPAMHQQHLTVSAAGPAPVAPECVPAKASCVGGCVGEVIDEKNMPACAMMSCQENACMQV